jgi:hypothetical protein
MSVAATLIAGIFLGGAIDHAILALRRSSVSPYHVRVGVTGNWALALLDLAVALAALLVARSRSG